MRVSNLNVSLCILWGVTEIFGALRLTNIDVVKQLLEEGADPNSTRPDGEILVVELLHFLCQSYKQAVIGRKLPIALIGYL